jgi:hypothetical protein
MPILFSFANDNDCTVASQFTNGQWNLDLLLTLSTTAHDQLHSVLNEFNSLNPFLNDQPEGRLLNTTGRKPTTKDFYRRYGKNTAGYGSLSFPYGTKFSYGLHTEEG